MDWARLAYWFTEAMRIAARSDANQESIIAALRAVGCRVCYIKEPLDLLVSLRGETWLIECKLPSKLPSKSQQEFIDRWAGKVVVVHNTREALEAILGAAALK